MTIRPVDLRALEPHLNQIGIIAETDIMIDTSTPRGKIVDAALRLAGTKGWSGLSLQDIATEAGVTLVDLRRQFHSKTQILTVFTRLIDDAVLSTLQASDADASTRDRLFDVLMTRFEAMAPYKAGLKHAAADLRLSPGAALAQLIPVLQSQYWMLAAAGVSGDGWRGRMRVKGLAALYGRVLDIWLHDDDPAMGKTMAALDLKLRRAGNAVHRFDAVCDSGGQFLKSLCGLAHVCDTSVVSETPAAPPAPQPEEAGAASV
jgi:ubiquinone biosynthesis protein COQ9